MNSVKPGVMILVPCYRNWHLVDPLVEGLMTCAGEDIQVIFINDSPDDERLGEQLSQGVSSLLGLGINACIKKNEKNIGFLRSANEGMKSALDSGLDVLLLNSDAVLFPGCFAELRDAAYSDPMVGFVSPRSNNAGICTINGLQDLSRQDAHAQFEIISRLLPRYQYVPTAVGFCLYIKGRVLAEVGFFDEIYGKGYNEENDLIMRANRYGYRALLCNNAFCWHEGSVSFSKEYFSITDRENRKILVSRYPEYDLVTEEYFNSASAQLEGVALGAARGIGDSLFHLGIDVGNMGPRHNGTSQMAVAVSKALYGKSVSGRKLVLHFFTNEETADFHSLRDIGHVDSSVSGKYAAVLHLAQPFAWRNVVRSAQVAPINFFFMLDTIAQDCMYLRSPVVEDVWNYVARYSDGLLYISQFSMDQFNRRYAVGGGVTQKVSLLSTDPDEYVSVRPDEGKHILIVGNHFAHKAVPETTEILSKNFPDKDIVVLGASGVSIYPNVINLESGHLADIDVELLYAQAECVVFPSHYEGFGFPLVKGVSYRKPTVVRDSPLVDEIREHLCDPSYVKVFGSLSELPGVIREITSGEPEAFSSDRCRSWDDVGSDVLSMLEDLYSSSTARTRFYERLVALNSRSWTPTRPFAQPGLLSEHEELVTVNQTEERRVQKLFHCLLGRVAEPAAVSRFGPRMRSKFGMALSVFAVGFSAEARLMPGWPARFVRFVNEARFTPPPVRMLVTGPLERLFNRLGRNWSFFAYRPPRAVVTRHGQGSVPSLGDDDESGPV